MPGFRAPDILGTWARMNEILLKEGGNAEKKIGMLILRSSGKIMDIKIFSNSS